MFMALFSALSNDIYTSLYPAVAEVQRGPVFYLDLFVKVIAHSEQIFRKYYFSHNSKALKTTGKRLSNFMSPNKWQVCKTKYLIPL